MRYNRRYASMSPPQVKNYFVEWIAEILGIHRDQLRGGLYHDVTDNSYLIHGCYRQDGHYHDFIINERTAELLVDEVRDDNRHSN